MNNKSSSYILSVIWVFILVLVTGATAAGVSAAKGAVRTSVQELGGNAPASSSVNGETSTLLPDGRLLIVGGQDSTGQIQAAASLRNPETGAITILGNRLQVARAWHTATVLPDGTVLILGGIGRDGHVVEPAELFDPQANTFRYAPFRTPEPRAFHTTTLLTDGSLLIAGGVTAKGRLLADAQMWNMQQKGGKSTVSIPLTSQRHNHLAALLPDGRVLLWGGKGASSSPLNDGEIFDPVSQTTSHTLDPLALLKNDANPELRASRPKDSAVDVPTDALISLRFSRPLLMQSLNKQTVVLQGPAGQVEARIVGAEGGMLAFVQPNATLLPGTTYSVTFSGALDARQASAAFAQFTFITFGPEQTDADLWAPTPDWKTHLPDSPWQSLPALHAAPGVTALAGQVLKLDGNPLAHVTLIIGSEKTFTDESGRFLLKNITAGHNVLKVNATTANTRTRAYGIYEDGVDITGGQTNVLHYTIWMTALDTAHTVQIPSPTLTETVISSPLLPGLELHLPANAVITGDDGNVVTQINITPVPLDRPPFPLPNVPVPIYFTIQPGSSYINVLGAAGPKGARLFYPNMFHYPPATQFNFWNYDADSKGWFVYGQGHVSPDASQVIPDPDVVIYEFTGAMVSNPSNAPGIGPHPGDPKAKGGEPVDMSTGLFVYNNTDLVVSDVIPLTLTRTYRQSDPVSRAFGVGTNHNFDVFMVGPNNSTPGGEYLWQELILPDGGRIHFDRISPCFNGFCDFGNAVFENTSSPTDFHGATITYVGLGGCVGGGAWLLQKKDGTKICFPDSDGLTISQGAAPLSIIDRHGNEVFFQRGINYNLIKISSPNGRWIKFSYDANNRIVQAQDNANRVVSYTYDTSGRLAQFVAANGGITNYTYDAFNQMVAIQDARGNMVLTNQYDNNGRVVKQTQADNTTFQFAYTTDPATGVVTQTDLTDPSGIVKRTTFSANGYSTSEIFALGRPEQQIVTYARDAATNLVTSTLDPLHRETDYTYDVLGNLLSVTTMARSSAAATVRFTYDPFFSQLTSVTDPLGHVTTYQHDPTTGNLTATIDPLGHRTSYTYFPNGQVKSVTDAAQNTVQFAYDRGDLTSITDPLANTTTLFPDAAGRTVSKTDPLGNTSRIVYNAWNQIIQSIDPRSKITSYNYDLNGNLASMTDALNHTTRWNYDSLDRLVTRTDPLLRQESYSYDLNGNLASKTDRKGQITTLAHDALNRPKLVGFNTTFAGGVPSYESTINYTYDAAGRATQVVDSAGGTVIKTFDDLNRTITETTAQGSITFAFDALGRRASMAVAGQPAVSYSYDNASRLSQISQGASNVSFTYDNVNRRSSVTLANGVSMSYAYDNNSRITGITYTFGANTLGNLTYAYDGLGRRTQIGGSFARTSIPQPVTLASYDPANQLVNWNGTPISYDANGNMLSDGLNGFTWNARNQVASLNGAVLQYDALGRRVKNASGNSFLYDGANRVQELSGSTVTANLLTGGVDENFNRSDATGSFTPLTDALGSTIALVDSTGAIATSYSYDPFGNTLIFGQPNANPFQYTGRENEGNGLYYYRARFYSPVLGRFISEDPARFGINFYAYAGNNPISMRDPFGLYDIWDFLQDFSDFANGASSVMTFGATDKINDMLGNSAFVNKCSRFHQAGTVAGIVLLTAITDGAGGEAAEAEEVSFFDNTEYTDKVLGQMEGGAGEYHSFPELVKNFEDSGTVTDIVGGDGQLYQKLEIPGSYGGKDGVFEFIKDAAGNINHRYFNPF